MTVYLYCRVSSSGQEENTSLEDQEHRGAAFVCSQRWPKPTVVRDVASGGTMDRPGLRFIQQHARSGDRVVVLKLDRLSRSLVGVFPLVEEWIRREVSLHSISEPIETGTAMGRSMLRMIFNFAETEREVIAERMAAGKARKALGGGFTGSPIPFGYSRGEGEGPALVPHPDEAAVVREMFQRFASGQLGMRRLKRLTGCPLSESAISDLLSNPLYAGRVRYKGQVQSGEHAPLVTDWVFGRVQSVKRARSQLGPKAAR